MRPLGCQPSGLLVNCSRAIPAASRRPACAVAASDPWHDVSADRYAAGVGMKKTCRRAHCVFTCSIGPHVDGRVVRSSTSAGASQSGSGHGSRLNIGSSWWGLGARGFSLRLSCRLWTRCQRVVVCAGVGLLRRDGFGCVRGMDEVGDDRPEAVRGVQPGEVSGSGDDLEARDAGWQGADISSAAATGVTGSSSPTDTRVGVLTRLSWSRMSRTRIRSMPCVLSSRFLGCAGVAALVWKVRAEGGEHAGPLLVGHVLAGVAAVGDLGDLVAAHPAEVVEQPGVVPAGESRLDDEPACVLGGGGRRTAARWVHPSSARTRSGCRCRPCRRRRGCRRRRYRGSTRRYRPRRTGRARAGRGR